jgi:hypothetical protein
MLVFKLYIQTCSTCHLPSHWLLVWLILPTRRWRWHVPLKCLFILNRLHGVISQKIELLNLGDRSPSYYSEYPAGSMKNKYFLLCTYLVRMSKDYQLL